MDAPPKIEPLEAILSMWAGIFAAIYAVLALALPVFVYVIYRRVGELVRIQRRILERMEEQ